MLILGLKRLISSYLYCVQGGFSSYVASHVDVLRSNVTSQKNAWVLGGYQRCYFFKSIRETISPERFYHVYKSI